MNLSIVIPVCENPSRVIQFAVGNKEILAKYPVIVINKKGGEYLQSMGISTVYVLDTSDTFWDARRKGLEYVKTKYVLNLDADTILPDGYVERAIEWLEACPKVGIVTINYQKPHTQDHGAFGTSVMRTEEMRKLYHYKPKDYPYCQCECKYMNAKVLNADLGTVCLELLALHLKEKLQGDI